MSIVLWKDWFLDLSVHVLIPSVFCLHLFKIPTLRLQWCNEQKRMLEDISFYKVFLSVIGGWESGWSVDCQNFRPLTLTCIMALPSRQATKIQAK
jgi:hypothetical protein